jgi:hypothetical protein
MSLAAVQELLWRHGDPIGVNHTSEARWEYGSYAAHILALLKNVATMKELTLHLLTLENRVWACLAIRRSASV